MYGGGQEQGLRSGTESLATSVGIATALTLIKKRQDKDVKHFEMIKDFFIQELKQQNIPFEINGTSETLPNILNICIPGLNSDYAVIQMDEYGVQCAAMTSCAGSKGALKSDVLVAMGKDECAGSSLRFSFGRDTKKKEVVKTVSVLKKVCGLQKVV
jgi:cysteine desulfurase